MSQRDFVCISKHFLLLSFGSFATFSSWIPNSPTYQAHPKVDELPKSSIAGESSGTSMATEADYQSKNTSITQKPRVGNI